MRSPFAILREIRHHSRRVERNRFDRIQSAGFVLFAFAAPVLVWKLQTLAIRPTQEVRAIARVFETIDAAGLSEGLRATEIKADDRNTPWRAVVQVADVELVQRTDWCGWPLATLQRDHATELAYTRGQSWSDARDREVRRTAEQFFTRIGKVAPDDRVRTHVAAWIFSSGAWWVMLSFGLAAVLAPIRLGWWLTRRTRTVVRQARIDRCHCPNCGYNAKHSILRGRCPECGSELYERPEY